MTNRHVAAPPSSVMKSRRFVDWNALSTASAINATAPLLHRKDIDRAALRHLGILAGEQQIHARLHLGRVDAPTGLHRDVLLAVYLERHRHRRDPRDRRELPEDFSSLSIEGA